MKWTNYMKKRYQSIMLGGTLFGLVLGVLAFGFIFILCGHFAIESRGLLSFFGGALTAVVAVIGNWHYTANKLMIIEAIETLHDIKNKLK